MRQTLSLSCLLVLCYVMNAQTVRTPSALRYTGIGTYSRHNTDAFSIVNNQAVLCNLSTAQAGFYTERRFMLQELNYILAAIGIPIRKGGIGFAMNRFGFTDYNETQVGIAYGKKLSDKIDIGVQFNYNAVTIASYGNTSAINAEIGTIWHFTNKLHGGIHLYNPMGSKYGKSTVQKIPSLFKMGFGYEDDKHFLISTEIAKEEGQPVSVNAGVHYTFHQQFFMRFGIATGNSNLFAGAGLKWGLCRLDITMSHHPQLGFTPGVLLIFSFKQPNKE